MKDNLDKILEPLDGYPTGYPPGYPPGYSPRYNQGLYPSGFPGGFPIMYPGYFPFTPNVMRNDDNIKNGLNINQEIYGNEYNNFRHRERSPSRERYENNLRQRERSRSRERYENNLRQRERSPSRIRYQNNFRPRERSRSRERYRNNPNPYEQSHETYKNNYRKSETSPYRDKYVNNFHQRDQNNESYRKDIHKNICSSSRERERNNSKRHKCTFLKMRRYLENRKFYDDKVIHLRIKRNCTLKQFQEYVDILRKNFLIGVKRYFTDVDLDDNQYIAPIALIILDKEDDLSKMIDYINDNKSEIAINASKWNWNHNINCK